MVVACDSSVVSWIDRDFLVARIKCAHAERITGSSAFPGSFPSRQAIAALSPDLHVPVDHAKIEAVSLIRHLSVLLAFPTACFISLTLSLSLSLSKSAG